jgi:hypothetical protein
VEKISTICDPTATIAKQDSSLEDKQKWTGSTVFYHLRPSSFKLLAIMVESILVQLLLVLAIIITNPLQTKLAEDQR